jgi:acetyltransferase-like isoleucine patch superfamily enzyme
MREWAHYRYELLKCWWWLKPRAKKLLDDTLPGRPSIERNGHVSFRAKLEGHRKNIRVRNGASVRELAWLNCMDADAFIEIGGKTLIMPYAKLVACEGFIKIGRDCTIHSFDVLYGFSGGLTIGNGVRIGTHVAMITGNHLFDDPALPILGQGQTSKGITIGDYVWIGNGVSILDGVTIGANSVLGAGCVVTRDIEPDSVCMGVPARCVRKRGEPRKASQPTSL